MPTNKELQQRLTQLEKSFDELFSFAVRMNARQTGLLEMIIQNEDTRKAELLTMRSELTVVASMVNELAGRHGFSPEQFNSEYLYRHLYFEQHYLEAVERYSPELAAKLDSRPDISEIPEGFLPMFPDDNRE
jgi:hypothetical protein